MFAIKENMTSNRDLRGHMNSTSVESAFSSLVSGGKSGYKTVIEKKKIPPKCTKCGRGGDTDQKFCPQCGGKMIVPITNCPSCKKDLVEGDKFCTDCGHNLQDLVIAS